MLEKLQDGGRNRIDMRIDSAISAAGSFTLQTPKVRPKNVFSCADVGASNWTTCQAREDGISEASRSRTHKDVLYRPCVMCSREFLLIVLFGVIFDCLYESPDVIVGGFELLQLELV